MTVFRRVLAAVCLLAMAAPAAAAWRNPVCTETGSGVDIELSSPFNQSPLDGYMPCWVTIKNRSGAARSWNVLGDGLGYNLDDGNKHILSQPVSVKDGETVRMPLLLPLHSSRTASYHQSHSITIQGYAVPNATESVPTMRTAGKPITVVTGMGDELATPMWTPLEKDYEKRGINLVGTPVTLDLLPADWRALSGFDAFWLTEAEYAGLDAARRQVVRQWIERGGTFFLCAQTLDPALRAGLGLPATGDEARVGYGRVQLVPWDGKTLGLETVSALIDRVDTLRADTNVSDATTWAMTKSVGLIPLNALFLIGFIVVFAVIVGPVNLFWLAGSARRHRLFWTTPVISVAASLLLIVVILLQDGFGGHGTRLMLTLLLPEQKEALVVQEQVSRTGVLLSRGFTVAEDVSLSSVKVGNATNKSYAQEGHGYSGDWFASRTVQAQRVEAILPSRAEIQLLNADAARAGAPPVVASSIPAALKEIYYFDPADHAWRGGPLRTGERITLRPYTESDDVVGDLSVKGGSALLDKLRVQFQNRRGSFYAFADNGPFIDTLSSIQWKTQHAYFLGPVTVVR